MSNDFLDQVQEALKNKDVPHVYVNGFAFAAGTADATLVFKFHGEPVLVLSMSQIIAKTLVDKLASTLSAVEDATKQRILTTDQMVEALNLDRQEAREEEGSDEPD